jgi:hypothetical protein
MRAIASAALAFTMLSLAPPTALAQSSAASPAPAVSPVAVPPGIQLARSRIDTMLRTGHADASWFSAGFLAQVSISQVNTVLAGLTASLGAYRSVEYTPTNFIAHFAKGTDDVQIHLDAEMKIDGLLFMPPQVSTTSLDDALRALQRVAGTVSHVIAEEGRSNRAALNPSESSAVGSAAST